jgi:hypothetical protein
LDSRNQWVGDDTAIGAEEGEGFAGPDVSAPTTRVIKQHIKTIKAILASGVRMCISQLKFRSINSRQRSSALCLFLFYSNFMNAEIVPTIGINNINGL